MGRIILVSIAVLVILWLVVIYNGLVRCRNTIESAFSTIDVMLKKRYDLIPNLVACVKQYAAHESETLARVTQMRNQAIQPSAKTEERVQIDNEINSLLRNIMVQVEAYPDLKANENFMHLQRTLNELEEQISAARRTFNAATLDYNNMVEQFPSNLIAGAFKFTRRSMFEVPGEERQNPDVKALSGNG